MMKDKILHYLSRFAFPQVEFAKSIIPFIDKKTEALLLDVPCGNGATSWIFSKLNNLKVIAYDINGYSISSASANFKSHNLSFVQSDIKDALDKNVGVMYICIINSLFLLPEPELLLQKVKSSLNEQGTLFIVIPNSESENFKWFQRNHPEVNKLILSADECKNYFSAHGFTLQELIPIVFTRIYGRNDVKFFSALAPFYLRAINFFCRLFKTGTPNYYTLVLKKSK